MPAKAGIPYRGKAVFDMQMMSLSTLKSEAVKASAKEIEELYKNLFKDEKFVEQLSRATDHRSRF